MILQYEIVLSGYKPGFHLITDRIVPVLKDLPEKGLVNLFIKHTSAALCLNENADPSVRHDFGTFFRQMVPEDEFLYSHTLEGKDDMPAHLKSSILGQSLTIPITNHRLALGTWQGIYYCEFRDNPSARKICITVTGE
ncbi:MAG: secondary thiamine-phosphate synthase enzyme YjbQ [Bacteroidales bacterium]